MMKTKNSAEHTETEATVGEKKKLLTKENIKKGIEIGKTVALVMAIVNLAKAVAVVVKETAEKTREERRKLEEERAGLELREPEEENAG